MNSKEKLHYINFMLQERKKNKETAEIDRIFSPKELIQMKKFEKKKNFVKCS